MSRADDGAAAVDVLVIGGGIMGSACGHALARQGADVCVLERSIPGAEASSAAAGMLGAQLESHHPGPLAELCFESRRLYGPWVRQIEGDTGLAVGYRACRALRVAWDDASWKALSGELEWQTHAGHGVEWHQGSELETAYPYLSTSAFGAAVLQGDAIVDPPRLLRALQIAAEGAGVRYATGKGVREVAIEKGRVVGVRLQSGELLRAKAVIVAAGSWSNLVQGVPLGSDDLRPVRGQMIELRLRRPLFEDILSAPGIYLAPRLDGRITLGSTLESVGFTRGVTAGGIGGLLGRAIELVPALAGAEFCRAWSSFRPFAGDNLPYVGSCDVEGLFLATGHHRNGILLAPWTAQKVSTDVLQWLK